MPGVMDWLHALPLLAMFLVCFLATLIAALLVMAAAAHCSASDPKRPAPPMMNTTSNIAMIWR